MTTTIYQDIRAALQQRAQTADGFPADPQIAYEGIVFTPTPEVPWARLTLSPTSIAAYTVNVGTLLHKGLFMIDLFYPLKAGTGLVESIADNVRAVFVPGQRLAIGQFFLQIDSSSRTRAMPSEWLMVPVTVGWKVFASR